MCEVDLMRSELDLREMQLRTKEEEEGMKCKLKNGWNRDKCLHVREKYKFMKRENVKSPLWAGV